jgi:integrase
VQDGVASVEKGTQEIPEIKKESQEQKEEQTMIYKRGKIYWYKFMWQGRLVRESTKQGNDKVARQMESAHRTALAKGEVGIRERKPKPTLAEFLRKDFLPYTNSSFAAKPATARYYATGVKSLLRFDIAHLRLDEITDQHARQYEAQLRNRSAATVNCGLRTLRRALSLATEWGKLERRPKVTLAKGERQRERVLTDEEVKRYLEACPQPWRDVAIIMLGTGMRPGEVFSRRWEQVLLNGDGGLIQIVEGKSRAARRVLPMVPEVYQALEARYEAQGRPAEGWVFPSDSKCGHFTGDSAKNQHARALKESKVKPFEPYCLRHTALTRLGEAACDAFTLARIAGHSSITITQRYCHPQADAIERAFAKMAGGHNIGHSEEGSLARTTKSSSKSLTATKG